MTEEVCDVYASHMVTLLGMRTWSLQCDHKSLAIVSIAPAENVVYVTLLVDSHDIAFKFDGFAARKLYQAPHVPGIEVEDTNGQNDAI